jgi:probable selenium-dependent hydroxylase accessory protein YqeC
VSLISLLEDFGIDDTIRVIAIVGAGGKTSLMYALARKMASGRKSVVSTTTTKIAPPKRDESPATILLAMDPELRSLPVLLKERRHVTVAASLTPGGKLEGIAVTTVKALLDEADAVIIEADGAARLPVKAPEAWEPVIPEFADLVIPVVGLDCIGKPATEEWVFRLDRFLNVTGLKRGEAISGEAIARLLLHPAGCVKGVPRGALVTPFLNKSDQLDDQNMLARLTNALGRGPEGRIKRLVVGKLRGGVETRSFILGRHGGQPQP